MVSPLSSFGEAQHSCNFFSENLCGQQQSYIIFKSWTEASLFLKFFSVIRLSNKKLHMRGSFRDFFSEILSLTVLLFTFVMYHPEF